MTKKELIEALKDFPDDIKVFIYGRYKLQSFFMSGYSCY